VVEHCFLSLLLMGLHCPIGFRQQYMNWRVLMVGVHQQRVNKNPS